MKKTFIWILVITLSQALYANLSLAKDDTYKGKGTTDASFLKIGVGARSIGMGEAVCAATRANASKSHN